MKVTRLEINRLYVLAATKPLELELFEQIKSQIGQTRSFNYSGRRSDPLDERFSDVILNFGGTRQNVVICGITRINHPAGGIDLVVRGDEESDRYEVNGLRNACFFGHVDLDIVEISEVDGQLAIAFVLAYCQHCQAAMLDMVECEWRTCHACAAKCEHSYKLGPVHGGGSELGLGSFCTRCGRAEPKGNLGNTMSQAEQHSVLEELIGVQVVYKDTPLSPEQVVALEQEARARRN